MTTQYITDDYQNVWNEIKVRGQPDTTRTRVEVKLIEQHQSQSETDANWTTPGLECNWGPSDNSIYTSNPRHFVYLLKTKSNIMLYLNIC